MKKFELYLLAVIMFSLLLLSSPVKADVLSTSKTANMWLCNLPSCTAFTTDSGYYLSNGDISATTNTMVVGTTTPNPCSFAGGRDCWVDLGANYRITQFRYHQFSAYQSLTLYGSNVSKDSSLVSLCNTGGSGSGGWGSCSVTDTGQYRYFRITNTVSGNFQINEIEINGSLVPTITSWGNTQTNNASLNLILAPLGSITFNATANQTITTWNWTINGNDQNNNDDELTAVFSDGVYTVGVNGTNTIGTTNTITWNLTVVGYDTVDLFWSSSSSGSPSILSSYRDITNYIFFSNVNRNPAYDYNITFVKPDGSNYYNLSINNIDYGYASWYIPSNADTGTWTFRMIKRDSGNNTYTELDYTVLNIRAGSTNRTNVYGFVLQSGTTNPISGATVSMGSYSTTTNVMGYYNLTNILDGNYFISASKSGYNYNSTTITVSGVPQQRNIYLTPYVTATATATATSTSNVTLREKPITGDNEIKTNFWNLLFIIAILIIFGYFSGLGDRR